MNYSFNCSSPMKTILFTALLAFFSLISHAQQGKIEIEQDPRISKLLELYTAANSAENYYTIQVGFGSFEKAQKLKEDVAIDFPGWYSKIVFDSPTYRVHIGRFSNKLEAERQFIEVRKKYPESLLLSPEKKSR